MKNDLNIKNIDALGRIVIPSTIRKKMKINSDTMLSFNLENDSIVIKKINSLEENNNSLLLKILEELTEKNIIIVDLEKVVESSDRKHLNCKFTQDLKKILEKRQKKTSISLQFIANDNYEGMIDVYPILKNSNLYGAIVILLKNSHLDEKVRQLVELVVKLYAESYF